MPIDPVPPPVADDARHVWQAPALSRRAFFTRPSRRAAGEPGHWIRVHRRAMACRFEVTLAGEHATWVTAARAALDEIDRIEEQLSVFRDTSAITDVNRRAAREAVEIDTDFFDLLRLSAVLHDNTGGAFDITSTPLSRCWGFLQRDGRLPPPEAIDAARACVGFGGVALEPSSQSVRFRRPGIELNLGAIGKGHALDRVAAGMRRSGVDHALVSAGRSSLLALGGRWQVDVVSPRVDRGPLARVWLRDAALGTSGAGVQFVMVGGTRYGHVIDPRTGWPASGALSASVIASSAAMADALSTAFLIGGAELAHDYCASHPNVLALVTPDDGRERPLAFGQHPGALVELA